MPVKCRLSSGNHQNCFIQLDAVCFEILIVFLYNVVSSAKRCLMEEQTLSFHTFVKVFLVKTTQGKTNISSVDAHELCDWHNDRLISVYIFMLRKNSIFYKWCAYIQLVFIMVQCSCISFYIMSIYSVESQNRNLTNISRKIIVILVEIEIELIELALDILF